MAADIKAFRLAHKYSLLTMSEMLGLSKSMISMIENGHRDLPARSARLFLEMQKQHPENSEPSFPPAIFQPMKDRHDKVAEEYLKVYRGDCQSELHKLTKLLNALKKRYEAAVSELLYIEVMRKGHTKTPLPATLLIELNEKAQIAQNELEHIAGQKPEIMQLKMEGLEQQLRSVKAMLGKNKKYLGLEENTKKQLPVL